ncbi:hypothetical protein Tsubulata_044754 [Turnera subulata]|uniref:Uncharacterized protein n=1 Tax=Turnera subulata TaxID=218843 RepID=A0A9Q0J7V3_9ROSI|nr:hypothetical protein Tsubulata_044754 [Turnera subulata]
MGWSSSALSLISLYPEDSSGTGCGMVIAKINTRSGGGGVLRPNVARDRIVMFLGFHGEAERRGMAEPLNSQVEKKRSVKSMEEWNDGSRLANTPRNTTPFAEEEEILSSRPANRESTVVEAFVNRVLLILAKTNAKKHLRIKKRKKITASGSIKSLASGDSSTQDGEFLAGNRRAATAVSAIALESEEDGEVSKTLEEWSGTKPRVGLKGTRFFPKTQHGVVPNGHRIAVYGVFQNMEANWERNFDIILLLFDLMD